MNLAVSAILGIDPGKGGGIAIYTKEDGLVRTVKMPSDTDELADLLAYYVDNYKPIAFLEKLNVRRGDTAVPGKIFGIEKMLENYGQLKTTLELMGVPFCMVHPLSWENKLGLRIRGLREEKAERKRRYASVAARWYPGNRVTLWNADALLIMHFGRYALANDLNWVRENLPTKYHDVVFEGEKRPVEPLSPAR